MKEGRLHKSLINAKINLIFYFISLFIAFYSRKIFLNCLGSDFIGLTGTLNNILSFLNLAELGIGVAVSFFLYKPILEKNTKEINDILSVLGYLYKKIGNGILCTGIFISLFFPLIFRNTIFNYSIIYFAYYSFLASSLIGYFINYRQILLTANQKNYIVAIYTQTASIFKTILQIYLAYNYKNLYLWVGIELIFSIIACIILNYKIDKEYPWLKCDKQKGKILKTKYNHIIVSTKQIFIHKIKDFLLTRSDEIMVFAFVSLKMVAYYGNYTLIINKISMLFNYALEGIGSGVGNLIAENNKKNIIKVFWELMTIRHFIAGLVFTSLFFLLEPFITLWLGKEYILEKWILYLLLINIYIMQSRGTVDMFNHAYGLYADTWSAWAELIINLGVTITIGYYLGIIGILLGKTLSLAFIVLWWKPQYLFSQGLKLPLKVFWNGNIRYYIIFIISFVITIISSNYIKINPYLNWISLITYSFIIVIIYITINITFLYYFSIGTKDLISRIRFYK